MLRLPPFELRSPRTLEEAAEMLAGEGPTTRLVAGGTDLWPNMKRRHQQARTVIRLMSIPELRGISNGGTDGELRIGATTILDEVASSPAVRDRYPALARAVASISSPPLRNMGTIGGNLCLDTRCTYYNQTEDWRRSIDYCMKEAGTVCWVAPSSPRCWAHSASDSAPMLCALDARVRLVSSQGERVVAAADLFRDDGIDYLAKRSDEILTEILLPAASATGNVRSAFWKLRRRGSIDFAVLSVAVAVRCDAGGRVDDARIWLGAVGSEPAEATDAAQALQGRVLDEETIAGAARLARKVARPMDNTDFQAQWRGKMVEVYTSAALKEAAGLDPGVSAPRH
ncbi:MAG: FAD binding domain-containing protein [Thermoanaerobaculia bacterium]